MAGFLLGGQNTSMAFDEKLASTVREHLARQRGLTEKKMFGGLAFLVNGNMSVGIYGDELIVRIAPATTDAALKEPGARLFDITGRPMKGWLLVGGAGTGDPKSLGKWIRRGVDYAASLPKK
jgi:TfoX/Sxy family transcriptional regulator of competence genes